MHLFNIKNKKSILPTYSNKQVFGDEGIGSPNSPIQEKDE
jgi:hypothetical protein